MSPRLLRSLTRLSRTFRFWFCRVCRVRGQLSRRLNPASRALTIASLSQAWRLGGLPRAAPVPFRGSSFTSPSLWSGYAPTTHRLSGTGSRVTVYQRFTHSNHELRGALPPAAPNRTVRNSLRALRSIPLLGRVSRATSTGLSSDVPQHAGKDPCMERIEKIPIELP